MSKAKFMRCLNNLYANLGEPQSVELNKPEAIETYNSLILCNPTLPSEFTELKGRYTWHELSVLLNKLYSALWGA